MPFIKICILMIILMSMLTEQHKIFKEKSHRKRRFIVMEVQSRHITKPCEKKHHVLICPCHSVRRNLKKLSRRQNKRSPDFNVKNFAYHEAGNVNHLIRNDPLINDLSSSDLINPFVSDDVRKIDDDDSENSKGDPAGLFDYLRNRHGDQFLEKLKNNLKERGIELRSPEDKKSKRPEYDRKKDEKDALLKYKKWQTSAPVEHFQTDFITQDSSFESTNSDVSENSASLKTTDKLKPAKGSKKGATNESVADSINKRIDNEILPALAAISKQLNELKEKENVRTLEARNNAILGSSNAINASSNAINPSSPNPEGFPCRLDGSWISDLYGVKITISPSKNMSLNVKVNSSGKNSSGFIDAKWTIEGFTLAKFGGPFALIGIYPEKRGLVSFVGQCKVCKDEEAIVGLWSVCSFKTEKNESVINIESKADVMRKDKALPSQKGSKLEDDG